MSKVSLCVSGGSIVDAVDGVVSNSLYVEVETDIHVSELNTGLYKLIDGIITLDRDKFISTNSNACRELGIL